MEYQSFVIVRDQRIRHRCSWCHVKQIGKSSALGCMMPANDVILGHPWFIIKGRSQENCWRLTTTSWLWGAALPSLVISTNSRRGHGGGSGSVNRTASTSKSIGQTTSGAMVWTWIARRFSGEWRIMTRPLIPCSTDALSGYHYSILYQWIQRQFPKGFALALRQQHTLLTFKTQKET